MSGETPPPGRDVGTTMTVPAVEPAAGPWAPLDLGDLLRRVLAPVAPRNGPVVLAVDGRGASGKSTLTDRLVTRAVAEGLRAGAVHTDDVAWNHSFFDWADLLRDGVLVPARRGEGVRYRPPAWPVHGRDGAVEVPQGTDLLVVEGVGAGRRELSEFLDVVVWVQSDFAQAERRGIARDTASGVNGDEAGTIAFWHQWMDEELRFLAADRPWERADVVVAGTPVIPLRPHEVAVSVPGRAGTATGPPPTPTT
ncbi:uridine kinase [Kineococcus sp. GCM10028916]|uniref:uridine kinase family protein n=1 Tax=Kineococcus sp. GCM10028916 TaxID=3273394 RepID=UPI00362F7F5F